MSQRILEIKRKTLIKYSRKDTPERASRADRLRYSFDDFYIKDLKENYDATFVGTVSGGASPHKTVVTAHQILENVRQYLLVNDKQINDLRNNDAVSIISQAVKENDLEVYCDCEDFQYRFAYTATLKGYNIKAKKEKRPASETNPYNKGALCKHLLNTFKYNTFIRRGSAQFLRELKNNEQYYLDAMNLEYPSNEDTAIDSEEITDEPE